MGENVSVAKRYEFNRLPRESVKAFAACDAALPAWLRARDVLAGEDAVKAGGEKYLPRLDNHIDEQYDAYRARASFFNASARTADGYVGLVFRRPPFVKVSGRTDDRGQRTAHQSPSATEWEK